MKYDGTYEMTSHFGKGLTHPGTLVVQTDGRKITGKAAVPGIKADVEDGILDGNHFSFVMRKKIIGKTIEMKVDGTFEEGGSLRAVMNAPFGSSWIEGHKIS